MKRSTLASIGTAMLLFSTSSLAEKPAAKVDLKQEAIQMSEQMDRLSSAERQGTVFCQFTLISCAMACSTIARTARELESCIADCQRGCSACAQIGRVPASTSCINLGRATGILPAPTPAGGSPKAAPSR